MAALEFTETNISAQVRKEVTCEKTLSVGDELEAKIGVDELTEVVPAGKQWAVIVNVRLVETDV